MKNHQKFPNSEISLASLFSSFNKKYAEFGEWYKRDVVLCGLSNYAKRLADSLINGDIKPSSLTIIDSCGAPDYRGVKIYTQDMLAKLDKPSYVFIVCTNPYMGFYARLLKGRKNVMTYHLLSLCDKRFNYPLARYDARIIRQYIEHYVNEREFYSRFSDSLADDKSKDIMSRLITYLYTLDYAASEIEAMPTPYFDPIIPENSYDVFVDCGGYNGDTLRDFLASGRSFSEYWLFEPDADLINEARKVSSDSRIKFNNVAVGDFNGYAYYEKTADMSTTGQLTEDGNTRVAIGTIDDLVKSRVTAIKWDVEGAEHAAVTGASQTIASNRPLLIISAEHKPDDIKTLSELVTGIVPDYKFYLRCCCDSLFTDLTMYAII